MSVSPIFTLLSQERKTTISSGTIIIIMIIEISIILLTITYDVTQALESGPPEEQKHVKLPVA